MPQLIRAWEGTEWQNYIVSLLKIHYGVRDFQAIPDGHGGDFGLEGFSTDGCAYQCYAPQEPLSTKERYEKQRTKITTDINKFINNEEDLKKILGTTIIKRWVLLVPEHNSALLNQHAEAKAAEVRAKKLPYISNDFRIHIGSDDFFELARRTLIDKGIAKLHIDQAPIAKEEIDKWKANNGQLINTLVEKLSKLPAAATKEKLQYLQSQWLKHYLTGENMMSLLHEQYPDVFEKIHKCKSDREEFLATDSLISPDSPEKMLVDTLKEFIADLESQVKGLDTSELKKVAYASIAEWLLRCPLDFPERVQ